MLKVIGCITQQHDIKLVRTGLAPHRLELEMTECVLIHHPEQALDTLKKLRGLVVRLSLDDFGTGYSSLSYLRRFPFNKTKSTGPSSRPSVKTANPVCSPGRSLRWGMVWDCR
jgi:predicted signal transduction protein with EAL and GGDEF domain